MRLRLDKKLFILPFYVLITYFYVVMPICCVHSNSLFPCSYPWNDVITCNSKQITFWRFFLKFPNFLMFLYIQIYLLILKTYYGQFTLTTKKSLHIIFKGCRVTHCMLYLLPLYCLLSPMHYHLLLDSYQKAIKPDLIVYFGKLLDEDFVAKLLALTSSYWLQIKKLFL